VSVGSEGAIFIWQMPEEVIHARADNELPTISKEKYTNNDNNNKTIPADTKTQSSKGSQKRS